VAESDESDAELVGRIQRGDQAAFDRLARRYERRAFAVAQRLMQNVADAEDVLQDAFIAAVNAIDSFDARRPFAPWFMRIVVNKGLTALRSRASEGRLLRDTEVAAADALSPPSDVLQERREIQERFHAALLRLPERQRLVVQLADVEGFTSEEISTQLEIPSGTVRWLLHEARAKLREALAPLRRDES
jgi:RNA polymerase sigma-70 factor (ECF subfamily)